MLMRRPLVSARRFWTGRWYWNSMRSIWKKSPHRWSFVGIGHRFPDDLPPFRLATREDYSKIPPVTHGHVMAINGIPVTRGFTLVIGRQTRSHCLCQFITNSCHSISVDTDWLRALDIAILQKILPRLQGNRARLEEPLARLVLICGI